MQTSHRPGCAFACAILLTTVADGATIHVPADHATIQGAIDAAVAGDTVVVAPGTYTGWANRDLDFAGKAITVRSSDPGDPAVVAATVIDCQQAGRGFIFQSGETSAAVVDGLTVTNGFATDGAGVLLLNGSGATIRNSVFTGNITPSFSGIIQSGNNPVEPADLAILNCTIQNNLGSGFTSYFIETLTVTDCTISNNTGAGISTGTFGTSEARIDRCTVSANGDVGIRLKGDLLEVSRCTVTDNAQTGVSLEGTNRTDGGVSVEISNSIISRNTSVTTVGGLALASGTSALVRNCLVTENIGRTAGGMRLSGFAAFTISTSTIADNVSTEFGGGGIRAFGTDPTDIRNCILWGNTAPEGEQLMLDSGFNNPAVVAVAFSDLEGGEAAVAVDTECCSPSQLSFGPGNLDVDPLFVDPITGDYHLAANSPVIDEGDPGFIPSFGETDIDGDPRVVNDTVDPGADEFRRPGDVDGDGVVGILDFLILLGSWGPCPDDGPCPADFDGDGFVGIGDFLIVLGNWTA